jgi:hypothetical protein
MWRATILDPISLVWSFYRLWQIESTYVMSSLVCITSLEQDKTSDWDDYVHTYIWLTQSVVLFHFCDVAWVMSIHKRFSTSGFDPTKDLALITKRFEEHVRTVEN